MPPQQPTQPAVLPRPPHPTHAQHTAHAQPQPQNPPIPATRELRQAFADAHALLNSTRMGLVGIYDSLLENVAREMLARDEELAGAKAMNARIERDYRDLYRLALSLQRRADRSEGEVKVLRALRGRGGTGEGARAVEALDKVREREDRLWGAVDRCIQRCQCGAARENLSPIVLLPRTSSKHQHSTQPHQREASAHSHDQHQQQRRPSTQSQQQLPTPLTAAHRRFSTSSTTAGSPVVPNGSGGFRSPVVPSGSSAFPVFNGIPQSTSRPASGASVSAGAFHFSTAQSQSPVVVQDPPIVPSQMGLQPAVPQPQPRPQQTQTHTMTPAQLLALGAVPGPACDLQTMQLLALQQAQAQRQAGGSAVPQPVHNAANFVAAAKDQANGLAQLPSYPEQPQASTSRSLLEPSPPPPPPNQSQTQTQALPDLSSLKAAQVALAALGDRNSPLRDALRSRAGLPPRQTPSSSSASSSSPSTSTSTPIPSSVRTRLLAELATRLRNFPSEDARALLELKSEQTAALVALSRPGEVEVRYKRVIGGLSVGEMRAVAGLVRAVCVSTKLESGEGGGGGGKEKEKEVIDLTDEGEEDVKSEEQEACKTESENMQVDDASTSQQVDVSQPPPPPAPALDDSPSRRRARSDSGVGTDISDASGSGDNGRAPKRARMSIDGEGETREEGEISSPHLGEGGGGREVQQTLTPDATPRLSAAVPAQQAIDIESRTPSLPEARMVEREAAPEDQGSIDPRALTVPSASHPAPPPTVFPLSSAAQTAFVNNFMQSLTNENSGNEVEQILGALKKAESASGTAEGIVEAALAGSSTCQEPPPTPTPSALVPPDVERTRSVPIESVVVVPASALSTPAGSRRMSPSPFVQGGGFEQSAFVQQQPGQEQPGHSLVQQSEQLLQMRTQAGYDGAYTGPPSQSYEIPLQMQPPPPPPAQGQEQAQAIDTLPQMRADLEDGGDLPRLPDEDELTKGKVLGPDHLALAFALDGSVGGWVCRMCLQRKEEVDPSFPVPVYPYNADGTMSNDMRGVMSAHCASTHVDAFSFISDLSTEEAREELREMLEG